VSWTNVVTVFLSASIGAVVAGLVAQLILELHTEDFVVVLVGREDLALVLALL